MDWRSPTVELAGGSGRWDRGLVSEKPPLLVVAGTGISRPGLEGYSEPIQRPDPGRNVLLTDSLEGRRN
jgi:hypothetical protein